MTIPKTPVSQEQKEVKFTPLRGCEHIEASSYLLRVDGHSVLLDAGYKEERPLDIDLLESFKPEGVFISHAHLDHVGSLPIVRRTFPSIPIFMTPPTKALASEILRDARRVAHRKEALLFTEQEIDETLEQVTTVEFDQELDSKGLKFVFRQAGHILGASYILFRSRSKILYTGDLSLVAFLTTPPAYIPSSPEDVDLLIMESTYGGTLLPPREEEIDHFCLEVKNVIRRGGRVLIPSFALGRAQEVLTILLNKMEAGYLDKVPVVLDGLAIDIAGIYYDHPTYLPGELYRTCYRSRWLHLVETPQDRERIINNSTPVVIIAPSGMLTGGPSVKYAAKILTEEKSAILMVGYQDEEAPGSHIAGLKSGEPFELRVEDGRGGATNVSGTTRCEIREYKLSAHSDQQGLVEFATSYHPASVLLVHGEDEAKVELSKVLRRSSYRAVLVPEDSEEIDVCDLISLWEEIILAESQRPKTSVGQVRAQSYQQFIEEAHDKYPSMTFQFFKEALTSTGLLGYCGSLHGSEDTIYDLLAWSLKYAQIDEQLNFEFPAMIFGNGVLFLQLLYGRGFKRRFLTGFQNTVPAFFKNLIMRGGPEKTRGKFRIYIGKDQLSDAIESFGKHFGRLGISAPTFSSIQGECAKDIKNSELQVRYSNFFGTNR